MEGKNIRFFLFYFFGIFGLFPAIPVNAYDQFYSHPALTAEMAILFNARLPLGVDILSAADIQAMKIGSIEEDEMPRMINHFYDPVHDSGWNGNHFGYFTQEEAYAYGVKYAPQPPEAAINWVIDQQGQGAYGRQKGNQTWQRAIHEYLNGDKEAAFIALGHVLHLLEDMSVPDHTRNDSHAHVNGDPGSPFEEATEDYIQKYDLVLAQNLIKKGVPLPKYKNVREAMIMMAKYSNNNFFSEDTIDNSEFNLPSIKNLVVKSEGKYSYLYDVKNKFYLARVNDSLGFERNILTYTTKDNYFIMPSYREHLFPKVVLTGAGVIRLFFEDVEKYKKHPELLEPLYSDKRENLGEFIKKKFPLQVLTWCDANKNCLPTVNEAQNMLVNAKNTVLQVASSAQEAITSFFNNNVVEKSDKPNIVIAEVPQPAEKVLGEKIAVAPVKSVVAKPAVKIIPPPTQLSKPIILTEPKLVSEIPIATVVIPPAPQQVEGQKIFGNATGGSGSASLLLSEAVTVPSTIIPVVVVITTSSVVVATTTAVTTTTTVTSTVDIFTPLLTPTITTAQSDITSAAIDIVVTTGDTLLASAYFELSVATSSGALLLVTSTNATTIFLGERGQTYYFNARVIEGSRISSWSATSTIFVNWSSELIINEVAWAGTISNAQDQWFEIYNTTDADIDMTGWKFLIDGLPISFTEFANPIIPARGYGLFERGRDKAVNDIIANGIYINFFASGGNILKLVKPDGSVSDVVDASASWFYGNAANYKTMERVEAKASGSAANNWQNNFGPRTVGRSAGGGRIGGSPGAANFGNIVLVDRQDDIMRTLTPVNNPYILESYEIPVGKTLTIDSGVIIKSYYDVAAIDIYGSLITNGNVVMTSGRDVSVGGGTVGMLGGSPAAEDWQGLHFHAGSTGNLNGLTMRYAGHRFFLDGFIFTNYINQALRAESAALTINNSIFEYNGPLALRLISMSANINNTIFSFGDRAIEATASLLDIQNTSFTNFGNSSGPVIVQNIWPNLENITLSENAFDRVYLSVQTVSGTIKLSQVIPYYFDNITIPVGATLAFLSGTVAYLAPFGVISVAGNLVMSGTLAEPIFLVSNGAENFWGQVRFNGGTGNLRYVTFNGGHLMMRTAPNDDGMMVLENGASVVADHVNFLDYRAPGNAVLASNSTLVMNGGLVGFSVRPTFETIGIRLYDGDYYLDDIRFQNLSYGIYQHLFPLGTTEIHHLNANNFNNVDIWTMPTTLVNPD